MTPMRWATCCWFGPRGAADLGEPVPDDLGEQFALAGRKGLVITGTLDVVGADVASPGVARHGGLLPRVLGQSGRSRSAAASARATLLSWRTWRTIAA
jgi:hypothetical protein